MSPRAMQSKATWASCVAAWSSRDASSRAGLPFSVSASVITVYLPVYDLARSSGVRSLPSRARVMFTGGEPVPYPAPAAGEVVAGRMLIATARVRDIHRGGVLG